MNNIYSYAMAKDPSLPDTGCEGSGPALERDDGPMCTVLLTTNSEDAGKRATLAFSLACTARSMERPAFVYLAGDGAHWAYAGNEAGIHVSGFPPLGELIRTFTELGGVVYVCSACDDAYNLMQESKGTPLQRHPGIQQRGLAAALDLLLDGRTITF